MPNSVLLQHSPHMPRWSYDQIMWTPNTVWKAAGHVGLKGLTGHHPGLHSLGFAHNTNVTLPDGRRKPILVPSREFLPLGSRPLFDPRDPCFVFITTRRTNRHQFVPGDPPGSSRNLFGVASQWSDISHLVKGGKGNFLSSYFKAPNYYAAAWSLLAILAGGSPGDLTLLNDRLLSSFHQAIHDPVPLEARRADLLPYCPLKDKRRGPVDVSQFFMSIGRRSDQNECNSHGAPSPPPDISSPPLLGPPGRLSELLNSLSHATPEQSAPRGAPTPPSSNSPLRASSPTPALDLAARPPAGS